MLTISFNRFVFEVSLSSLYLALPGIGEVHKVRGQRIVVNR